jgi:hypothetical protein
MASLIWATIPATCVTLVTPSSRLISSPSSWTSRSTAGSVMSPLTWIWMNWAPPKWRPMKSNASSGGLPSSKNAAVSIRESTRAAKKAATPASARQPIPTTIRLRCAHTEMLAIDWLSQVSVGGTRPRTGEMIMTAGMNTSARARAIVSPSAV